VNLDRARCEELLFDCGHGILATRHPLRGVDAVPVCFVIDGDSLAVPVDRVKPKVSTDLERVRNLDRDARGVLLCDHWDPDDWSRLWWVRASLTLVVVDGARRDGFEASLRRKYPGTGAGTLPTCWGSGSRGSPAGPPGRWTADRLHRRTDQRAATGSGGIRTDRIPRGDRRAPRRGREVPSEGGGIRDERREVPRGGSGERRDDVRMGCASGMPDPGRPDPAPASVPDGSSRAARRRSAPGV
jgi:hypothetical protein